METKLSNVYRDLLQSLRKIENDHAWVCLFEEERLHRSPDSPLLFDRSQIDLKTEVGYFWYLHQQAMELLSEAPPAIQKRWKPQMERLWKRFRSFAETEAFKKT